MDLEAKKVRKLLKDTYRLRQEFKRKWGNTKELTPEEDKSRDVDMHLLRIAEEHLRTAASENISLLGKYSRQEQLPFESCFNIRSPFNPLYDIKEECVPGWLDAHSPAHAHGQTHVHFELYHRGYSEEAPREDGPGYVYYLKNSYDKLIKIGETSRTPETRRKELQTGAGHRIILLASQFVKKRLAEEDKMHEKFETDLVEAEGGDEWYFPSERLLKHIAKIRAEDELGIPQEVEQESDEG